MGRSIRLVLADLILAGMILTAGYINLTKDSSQDIKYRSSFLATIIYTANVRNLLHIAGFSLIGYLVASSADKSTKWIVLRYAIAGGIVLEVVQLITGQHFPTVSRLFDSTIDIGLNSIGVLLGAFLYHRYPVFLQRPMRDFKDTDTT